MYYIPPPPPAAPVERARVQFLTGHEDFINAGFIVGVVPSSLRHHVPTWSSALLSCIAALHRFGFSAQLSHMGLGECTSRPQGLLMQG